jgi:arylsulfatase
MSRTSIASASRSSIIYGAFAIADKFAATFKDFPPAQKPGSFTIDDALAKMAETPAGLS